METQTAATAHKVALAADAKVAATTKALANEQAERAEAKETIVDNSSDWNLESREITTDQFSIKTDTEAVAAAQLAVTNATTPVAKTAATAALTKTKATLAAQEKDLQAAVQKGNFDKIKLAAAQNV